ncbi:hypothetical protein PUNSTDRAFT_138407 [Punctularia strigosozonata HHB-11173 SS5]|uniref:Uncharacterized protein n=1 Tax=Punctularia strigosozonata (strain HHB-11173) TaxID=741275 RepID=R7S4P3_PUNST|nr:uncharacterized protein PUNSTDRAFT_138407 [Punctularia strigosozonata HHB-11173 SS5]EIN04762.1 hypothetical protein PUNSTDRAFT_138407 [Punctularia strigosozonata HHB-11173 SS5]
MRKVLFNPSGARYPENYQSGTEQDADSSFRCRLRYRINTRRNHYRCAASGVVAFTCPAALVLASNPGVLVLAASSTIDGLAVFAAPPGLVTAPDAKLAPCTRSPVAVVGGVYISHVGVNATVFAVDARAAVTLVIIGRVTVCLLSECVPTNDDRNAVGRAGGKEGELGRQVDGGARKDPVGVAKVRQLPVSLFLFSHALLNGAKNGGVLTGEE